MEYLDFDAERWCIHLAPPYDYRRAVHAIQKACDKAGKSLAIAELPRPSPFCFRFMRRPNVYDWFAAKTNATIEEAKQRIDAIPVNVHQDFRCNAMNPMRFLGLAAAITQPSQVLVYESSGMDPSGTAKIHQFAREQYHSGCLIHVCWFPMSGSCPNTATPRKRHFTCPCTL